MGSDGAEVVFNGFFICFPIAVVNRVGGVTFCTGEVVMVTDEVFSKFVFGKVFAGD